MSQQGAIVNEDAVSTIRIEAITPAFGARVHVAPGHLLDEGVDEQCLRALDRHGVLVFPGLFLSDEDQVAFSRRLGSVEASKFSKPGAGATDDLGIYRVSLDPAKAKFLDYIQSNEHWHMDGTTYRIPPKATNLKCVTPPSSGGDTEFANLAAAYDDLPEAKKTLIANLRVVHSAASANLKTFSNPSADDLQRWLRDGPPTEQPLVWRQSDGRCSLVIGSTAEHIVGLAPAQSRALLDELLAWCTQPEYCYRHQWRAGDMVVFNNPRVLHRAHHYTQDSGRLMHRTTIMGSEAFQ